MKAYILKDEDFDRLLTTIDRDIRHGDELRAIGRCLEKAAADNGRLPVHYSTVSLGVSACLVCHGVNAGEVHCVCGLCTACCPCKSNDVVARETRSWERIAGELHDHIHEAAALVDAHTHVEIGWAPEEAIPILADALERAARSAQPCDIDIDLWLAEQIAEKRIPRLWSLTHSQQNAIASLLHAFRNALKPVPAKNGVTG